MIIEVNYFLVTYIYNDLFLENPVPDYLNRFFQNIYRYDFGRKKLLVNSREYNCNGFSKLIFP